MDLYCANCGEPWAMDHVLHDEPEEFDYSDGRIERCPCCVANKRKPLSEAMKKRAEMASVLADVLGDDVDGIAADMDDLESIGFFD